MRDLERLKEVRNYRVTGPQLVSLFGLAALVVVAAFVAGFEVGLWQRPVDNDLLSPGGVHGEREASEVLAALLAEREQESTPEPALVPERMVAPSLSESLDKIDAVAEELPSEERREATATDSAEAEASSRGEPPSSDALTTRDDTVRPTTDEPPAEEQPEEVSEPSTVTAEVELPSASGRRGYTVQLAAYESAKEASELIKSLKGQGYDAFHQRAEIGDKTWYRVRVGLHSSREAAEAEAKRIKKSSSFKPYVTSHP